MILTVLANILDPISDFLGQWREQGYSYWRVGLELLLIGVVVYATLRFLQGTRGARLMRAVGSIMVVSFIVVRLVAEKLQLDRIIHIYPYFLGAFFIITLIVFQPELRRGLLMLGANWWSGAWSREAGKYITPIVKCAGRLSKKKIGALIAVERNVALGAIIESGVRLNADTTSELLETIFWPGSVLHDMGVVIQNGRIVAASCQFPLAESEGVDLSLGSRHRAAIGLSHESDALVVVVSEETGIISIAERGILQRNLTPDQLRDILIDELTVRSKEEE